MSTQGMMKKTPGPRAPPDSNRPSLKITALSYSWANHNMCCVSDEMVSFETGHHPYSPEQLWQSWGGRGGGWRWSWGPRRWSASGRKVLGPPRKLAWIIITVMLVRIIKIMIILETHAHVLDWKTIWLSKQQFPSLGSRGGKRWKRNTKNSFHGLM